MVKPKATLLGLLAIAATGATGGLGRARLSHRNVNRVVGLAYGKKASHACPSLAAVRSYAVMVSPGVLARNAWQ